MLDTLLSSCVYSLANTTALRFMSLTNAMYYPVVLVPHNAPPTGQPGWLLQFYRLLEVFNMQPPYHIQTYPHFYAASQYPVSYSGL
jgi:hypothetical protein